MEQGKRQSRLAELIEEKAQLGRPEVLGQRVEVALAVPKGASGKLKVELSYVTHKAGWMPIYDARHQEDASGERVELSSAALVKQTTGEDWEDVELIATTARPALSEPLPELATIAIHGHGGREQRALVSSSRPEPHGQLGIERSSHSDAVVEHLAPMRVRVPSTERPTRVELFSATLPCRSRLEVAPLERAVAVRVAELSNQSGRVLLPGPVNVFRGAAYAGRTELGFLTPNQRFRIPLGTNGALHIERKLVSHPEEQGVLTGKVILRFECKTIVENLGAQPIQVLVRDRVPVSRTDQATVKISEIDPATERHHESGLTAIELELGPGETRELLTAWKLTAPAGFVLSAPEQADRA
jgi:hypothetical protein